MERLTKLVVVGWAAAALALEVFLASAGWHPLLLLSLIACAAAALLAAINRRAVGLVLAFAYLFPVLIWLGSGEWVIQFGSLWMAALFGAMLPDLIRTRWHIRRAWRAPLVCWALVVAASASIVVPREFDYTTAVLVQPHMANSAAGGLPTSVSVWALYVALVLVLGILWFDWLSGARDPDLARDVAAPLAVSGVVVAAVSAYQMAVDVLFLNPTVFGGLSRASGTLLDANIAGVNAAIWTGGVVMLARTAGRWKPYVIGAGVPLAWLVVWGSGSRTAFLQAVLVTAAAGAAALAARRSAGRRVGVVGLAVAAVAIAAAVGAGAVAALRHPGIAGPIQREWASLPSFSAGTPSGSAAADALPRPTLREFAVEMWNRNRYGAIATSMIARWPLVGVGVGSFQTLLPEFAGGVPLEPDNAQNWFRHQVAEFGAVGSLAWIAWVLACASLLARKRPAGSPLVSVWIGRAILLSFGLISFVGMPGQDVTVGITFWTMVFWYVTLVDPQAASPAAVDSPSPRAAPLGRWAWAAVVVVVVVFAAATAALANGSLRVPVRAQRVGWPYTYGFYDAETDAGGREFRWTGPRALIVLDAPKPWVVVTVSANHPDLAAHPLAVTVWADRHRAASLHLTSANPQQVFVRIPPGEPRLLLEIRTDRAVRPSDGGSSDTRTLGAMVSWTPSDTGPTALPESLDR